MQIILLSGGSGKRLWPLSNDARSKQFLRLLPDGEGGHESMVQRVTRQIREAGIDADIVIATGQSQIDPIKSQLGTGVEIITEPMRRDTFPAIALSCAHLYYRKGLDRDTSVVILPVDPFAEAGYFGTLSRMEQVLKESGADIVLMGIRPTYPSEKYGYIVPEGEAAADGSFAVSRFTEKPDLSNATKLMNEGAYWNGGVFAVRLGYIMDTLQSRMPVSSYKELKQNFGRLEKISFDYAVVEKAQRIRMVPYGGTWKDLGTWNTLAEEMGTETLGNVIAGEGTKNTTVINELNTPIVALGLEDLIIAASPDGVLVSKKGASSYLKPYVDSLQERPMFEERRWGEYRVVDHRDYGDGRKSLTKHITILPGKKISYQRHAYRDEIWTILSGEGEVLLEDALQRVAPGDVITIKAGQKHAIRAVTELHFIEVQLGSRLEEEDIERLEFDW